MSVPDVIIEPLGEDKFERTVQFLTEWVSDGEPAAREHLADHAAGGGSSLIAVRDHVVIGIVTIRWQSNYAGLRDRGIPWSTRSPWRGHSGGSASRRCS
jgi:hypothetical protein